MLVKVFISSRLSFYACTTVFKSLHNRWYKAPTTAMGISYTSIVGNSLLEPCEASWSQLEPNYAKLLRDSPRQRLSRAIILKCKRRRQFPVVGAFLALPHCGTIIPTTRKHGKEREQPKKAPKLAVVKCGLKSGWGLACPEGPLRAD
jgi:hypothetical protein